MGLDGRQLHKQYKPKNVEELQESLEQIRRSVIADILRIIPADELRIVFDHHEA